MRPSRLPRIVSAIALSAVWVLASPAAVRAASTTPPPNLSVDVEWHGKIDLEWQQLPAVLRAIATDLDRDGDLDVVATTEDQPIVVWINDGRGHLTRQRPRSAPPVIAHSGDATPPGSGSSAPQTASASTPSPVVAPPEGRAPPPAPSRALRHDPDSRLRTDLDGSTDPRGPPPVLL